MSACKVTVTRESAWLDSFRKYRVSCDRKTTASLKRGETAEFSVQPGAHELRVGVDWCSSNNLTFTLAPGGEAKFFCGNNVKGLSLFRIDDILIHRPSEYLWLAQATDPMGDIRHYSPRVPKSESIFVAVVLFVLLAWFVVCGYILLSDDVRVTHLKAGFVVLLFASLTWFLVVSSVSSGQFFLISSSVRRKETPIRFWFLSISIALLASFVTYSGIAELP
jgi:hypothetical protein